MDYKKKYEDALSWMRNLYPTMIGAFKEDAEHYFPELAESEDERIRKELLRCFDDLEKGKLSYIKKEDVPAIRAYLEKQKERERIVPEREATDFEIEVHEIIAQARSDKRLADKDVLKQFEQEAACALMLKAEKQKEQKPAEWSEGDEAVLDALIRRLEGEDIYVSPHLAAECLKSLKDRIKGVTILKVPTSKPKTENEIIDLIGI